MSYCVSRGQSAVFDGVGRFARCNQYVRGAVVKNPSQEDASYVRGAVVKKPSQMEASQIDPLLSIAGMVVDGICCCR